MKTAFVFSGGASLGSIEVGMLKAVVEHNIHADMILGTSVGSLNGAMFALDPTMKGVERLVNIWKKIRTKDVFPPSPITPIKNLATFGTYLISPHNLRTLLEEALPAPRFEDTKIPFYAHTVNIQTGNEVIFNRGLLLEALMASAAIPGVFPPQNMHSEMLVDGGLINNTPISTAVKLGAKRILVFPIGFPNTPEQDPKNLMEMLIRSFMYLLNRQLTADYHLYQDKVDLLIIPPPDNITVGPHDFSHSTELIEQAYLKASEWLSKGGFKHSKHNYTCPCDVHSQTLNLQESVHPDHGKNAKERIKANLPTKEEISESLHLKKEEIAHSLHQKKEKIIDSLETTKEELISKANSLKSKLPKLKENQLDQKKEK